MTGMKTSICNLILAAGESKRMGQAKLLLPYQDSTILENVIENCLSSRADKTVVVLGAYRDKIIPLIEHLPLSTSYNQDYKQGMLSSIQCGLRSLSSDIQAILIVLSDQPGIPGQIIDRLIENYHRTQKGIILPVYSQKRGHPVLIDLKYREEILNLSSDLGLRALVHAHAEDVLEVSVDCPNILKDIDTPDDYKHSRH
jgi:molybdenum cofactor cytidylyltransferase